MSKEIERLILWSRNLLSFMSKEIEKKFSKFLKNYLTNNKKYVIIYMIKSITKSMLKFILQDETAIAVLSYWLHIVNLLNLGDRVDDTD